MAVTSISQVQNPGTKPNISTRKSETQLQHKSSQLTGCVFPSCGSGGVEVSRVIASHPVKVSEWSKFLFGFGFFLRTKAPERRTELPRNKSRAQTKPCENSQRLSQTPAMNSEFQTQTSKIQP